jgi:hypothetical protein
MKTFLESLRWGEMHESQSHLKGILLFPLRFLASLWADKVGTAIVLFLLTMNASSEMRGN